MSLKVNKKAPTSSKKKSSNNKVFKLLEGISFDKDKETIYLFNYEQLEKLTNIKCTNDDFLLTLDYPQLLYEIIGGFYKCYREKIDFNTVIDFLFIIAKEPDFSLKNEDITILFRSPYFEKEYKIYRQSIDRLKTKISVKKGIFKCPVCVREKRKPDDRRETIEFQNRSSDEPMAIFNTCNNCGHKWIF